VKVRESDLRHDADPTRRPVGRPCRPIPDDFGVMWPKLSREEAEEHWRCHHRSIDRWADEFGREKLVLARKRYREAQRAIAARARRKRYTLDSPSISAPGSVETCAGERDIEL
jgi:hypothetical protein